MGGIGMPVFFIGLKYISAGKATLIFNVSPILVAVFAYFILKEQITKFNILAVIGSFIGVGFFTINNNNDNREESNYYYLGICLISLSCLCATGVAIIMLYLPFGLE
mmetsp:Transcript_2988/g.2469  ORF Transcript_2988/g.2469 Transcript_2988/m.2469 type:complete len:107 (+) Transcript_2988:379-699(+)